MEVKSGVGTALVTVTHIPLGPLFIIPRFLDV